MGSVSQTQTGTHLKILKPIPLDASFQHGDHTPTPTYASGTWALSKEHERMIKSAQRKMLRPLYKQGEGTKGRQKKTKHIDEGPEKDVEKTKDSEEKCVTDEETEEGSNPNSDCDQDSDVSPSTKTKMKQSIEAKLRKKNGSSTSREAQKK